MKWEQKVEVIETGGFFSRGNVHEPEVNELLAKYGDEGFEFVAAIPVVDASPGTKRICLFFKRPKVA